MCGIFGLINGTKNRHGNNSICKMFSDGVALNSIRGVDSVGIMQKGPRGIYADRTLGTGMDYARTRSGLAHIDSSDIAMFTVAHNRAATEGSVTLANCHPFEAIGAGENEYIIGVHNGTLHGWKSTADVTQYEVDSEWAINKMLERGHDAFKDFNGAYAFVWSDDREQGVLNIARNSQRPMFIAYVKNQDRMFFASEYQMLTWIAERNNVDLEPEIINLQPGQIYKFNLANPRTFTKTDTPVKVYNAQAATQTHAEKEQNKFVEGLRAMFFPSEKKETKPTTAPVVVNTTGLLASPVTPAVRQPSGPTIVTPGIQLKVSAEEVRISKAAELHQKSVSFEPNMYDEMTRELWGTCTLDGILYSCVMRQVSTGTYTMYRDKDYIPCTVIGASSNADIAVDLKELSLVLSRVPDTHVSVMPTSAMDVNRAGELMAENISKQIEKFQKENEDANSQKNHALG